MANFGFCVRLVPRPPDVRELPCHTSPFGQRLPHDFRKDMGIHRCRQGWRAVTKDVRQQDK